MNDYGHVCLWTKNLSKATIKYILSYQLTAESQVRCSIFTSLKLNFMFMLRIHSLFWMNTLPTVFWSRLYLFHYSSTLNWTYYSCCSLIEFLQSITNSFWLSYSEAFVISDINCRPVQLVSKSSSLKILAHSYPRWKPSSPPPFLFWHSPGSHSSVSLSSCEPITSSHDQWISFSYQFQINAEPQ